MSELVEVLTKEDIRTEVISLLSSYDPSLSYAFDAFLSAHYGINTKQLEKAIKQTVPEEFI